MKCYITLVHKLYSQCLTPLCFGICIGIAISLVKTMFLQIDCHNLTGFYFMKLITQDIENGRNEIPKVDFETNLPNLIGIDNNIELSLNTKDIDNKLIRPRYYSTELGMKDKVLVSVLSTAVSIHTFGIAINKTLNHFVDKLIFFIDGTQSKKFGLNIPIVGFKESKPRLTIFRILSYINDNYLNEYDYFMFINDHTYVNGKRLMLLLQQISINQDVYMGSLGHSPGSLYCVLDYGIILSQSILRKLEEELVWCIKNLFQDVTENLGRCIHHAANLPCKSTFQGEHYQSHILNDRMDIKMNLELLWNASFLKGAVTVGNLYSQRNLYYLHIYYLQEFILQTREEIAELQKKIKNMMKRSGLDSVRHWPVGSPPSHIPHSRYDSFNWETFNGTHLFKPSHQNVVKMEGAPLIDIQTVVNSSVMALQANSVKELIFLGMTYGYRRYDPTRGMDYLFSLQFKDRLGKSITKRTWAYKGLTLPEIVPVQYVTENTRVTIIVFIEKTDVPEALSFINFLGQDDKMEQITLLMCFLYEEGEKYLARDDPFLELKSKTARFSRKHYSKQMKASYAQLSIPSWRPLDLFLIDLILPELPTDSIILVSEARSNFGVAFLNRVRMNTIQNRQVFSAIPFILYHPSFVENNESYQRLDVHQTNGHFDEYYFKQMSFYISDYKEARLKFASVLPSIKSQRDLLRMTPVPKDTTLFYLFQSNQNMNLLRAVEPGLILGYKDVKCKEMSDVDDVCSIRQGLSLGPKNVLSKLLTEASIQT